MGASAKEIPARSKPKTARSSGLLKKMAGTVSSRLRESQTCVDLEGAKVLQPQQACRRALKRVETGREERSKLG